MRGGFEAASSSWRAGTLFARCLSTAKKPSAALPTMPTLGQVADEERFSLLRPLLQPVNDTPVDQLGADLRAGLVQDAGERARLMQAFFGACDAVVRKVEVQVHARADDGE